MTRVITPNQMRANMIEPLPKSELSGVKLAIVSDSLRHRQQIRQVIERTGLKVVFSEPLTP